MQQKFEIPPNCLPINFKLDNEWLFNKCMELPRKQFWYGDNAIKGYRYAPLHYFKLQKYLEQTLRLKGRWNMKFVYLEPWTELPWHKDKGTKCAVNWVINHSKEKLEYKDSSYEYDMAIVDTSKLHRVTCLRERILFKVSCFDMTYEELCTEYLTHFMYYQKNLKK